MSFCKIQPTKDLMHKFENVVFRLSYSTQEYQETTHNMQSI